jgi:hypothetical protein
MILLSVAQTLTVETMNKYDYCNNITPYNYDFFSREPTQLSRKKIDYDFFCFCCVAIVCCALWSR